MVGQSAVRPYKHMFFSLKRKEILTPATWRVGLEGHAQRHKQSKIQILHDCSRTRPLEESDPRKQKEDGGHGLLEGMGGVLEGDGGLFWGDEKVLEMMVGMVAQCECTQCL